MPALSCAASTAGGGCFDLLWWENEGQYEATVWDLRQSIVAGAVPFIARTQTAACKNLADELRSFIVNEGAS